MLTIQIEEIPENGLQREDEVSPDLFPQLTDMVAAGDARFPEPVQYRINVSHIAGLIEVSGDISTVVELACGRCLERYSMPFSSKFSLAYAEQLPECADEDGEEVELSADEMGLSLIEGEEISLVEPLQEQLLMALPIQPLCSDSCQGLCPQCGCNLNETTCSCQEEAFDTRFASLKDFKVNKDN